MSHSKSLHSLSLLLLLISALFFITPAAAMWLADGSPVCTATGNQYRQYGVSDGEGGLIVAWADNRVGEGGGTLLDLYAQRLDADGNALWTTDGILVAENLGGDFTHRITGDGAGGALLVWDTSSSGGLAHVLAQRLDPDGNLLWPAAGIDLAYQAWNPTVVSDGAEGAIVTWRDIRPGFGSSSIYAQRISAAGSQTWAAGGLLICVATGDKGRPTMISDRVGGAVISWEDERELAGGGNERVYAQRVNSLGSPLWTANGIPLTLDSSPQSSPQVVPDGSASGGAIVVWSDYRDVAIQKYAQRVDGSGLLAWNSNGVQLSAAPNSAASGTVVADGAGGALVSWRTLSSGEYDLYLQRIDSTGTILWGTSGVQVSTAAGEQLSMNLLDDGTGGVIIGWRDSRDEVTTDYDIYVQRFDGAGTSQWLANGIPLCTLPDYQSAPWLVTDGAGGAIAIWYDARNRIGPSSPNYDIYALQINPDGLIAPGCDVSPGVLDFGTINAGEHADLSFVLTNTGAGDLPGDVSEGCPHFNIVSGAGPYVLPAGQSLTVTVRYEPTAVGTHECTVATGSSICGDVACSGTAVVGAAIAQLVSPPSMVARNGYESPPAYGSIRIEGATADLGENPAITAEFGYGPDGTDPQSAGGWQWVSASFNQDVGDADEYVATVTPTVEGTYDYCYRFTFYGVPWLYGDLDGSNNGYTSAQAGDLAVVDLCTSLGARIYVDADATGTGYGTSWPDAVNELTEALELADLCPTVSQIWVAAGTYRPTGGLDRTACFQLRDDLAIYGGFAGTETLFNQRDWHRNLTILSGDIGSPDSIADNSYCVVAASLVTASAVLDGFTIEGANDEGLGTPTAAGGVYLGLEASPTMSNLIITNNRAGTGAGLATKTDSRPTLQNVVFTDNHATNHGGAISVGKGCSPTVTNGIFQDNSAGLNAGAVYVAALAARIDLINAVFYGNSAGGDGGAIYYFSFALSSSSLANASFSENTAGGRGGAVFIMGAFAPLFHNSVLWGNSATLGGDELHNQEPAAITPTHCLIAGSGGSGPGWNPAFGTDGGGNLDENPLFKGSNPVVEHPLFFWSWSPLINAGSNALVPAGVTIDVRGEARIAGGGAVDIGAYEHQSGPTGVDDPTAHLPTRVAIYQNSPNPFNPQTTIGFDLPKQEAVSLRVFDVSGRLVRKLITAEIHTPGRQEVVWNGRDDAGRQVASGTYFYQLEAGTFRETRRMTLVK